MFIEMLCIFGFEKAFWGFFSVYHYMSNRFTDSNAFSFTFTAQVQSSEMLSVSIQKWCSDYKSTCAAKIHGMYLKWVIYSDFICTNMLGG